METFLSILPSACQNWYPLDHDLLSVIGPQFFSPPSGHQKLTYICCCQYDIQKCSLAFFHNVNHDTGYHLLLEEQLWDIKNALLPSLIALMVNIMLCGIFLRASAAECRPKKNQILLQRNILAFRIMKKLEHDLLKETFSEMSFKIQISAICKPSKQIYKVIP